MSVASHSFLVLFDLDGTLVNTQWADTQAMMDLARLLDPCGAASIDVASFRAKTSGLKLAEAIELVCKAVLRPIPTWAHAWTRARAEELLGDVIETTPHVLQTLKAIRGPKAIVSNSPQALITDRLERAGIIDYFDPYFVSAYEVGHWKPSPALYRYALEYFGRAASDCVAVEDSAAGAASARAAGIRTILYTEGRSGPTREPSARANRMEIGDMRELPALIESVRLDRAPLAGASVDA